MQNQITNEVQKRLTLEKDINDVYRQMEQLKSGPGGIYDLSS